MIGVGGGTASGKTTLVDKIAEDVAEGRVAILRQDWYYKDQSHMSMEERLRVNYDHPDAFDTPLLVSHVESLKRGETVEAPTYDFAAYTRASETITVRPSKVIIVEGILVLHFEALRRLMDIKLYVDTDSDIRIIRRLKRDVMERGRTFESVMKQYLKYVRPMHIEFVEPTKYHADLVIPFGAFNSVVISLLSTIVEHKYSR